MASVLKKLQAFVPTMDDTVGNLGAVSPVTALPSATARPAALIVDPPSTATAGSNHSDAPQQGEGPEPVEVPKPKAKITKTDNKKKHYDVLPEIPRTSFGAMDARALRRTGRTMQISLKVKPELYEAMKIVSYEQGIGLGAMMEEMWDAYLLQRRGKRG